jgi:TRAP-type C4-dicarboxylate transport system substrate-binding protein
MSAAVAMTAAAIVLPAQAQEKVRWKMQSAFGSQLPHIGTSAVRFSKNIERLSAGKFEIKFYEPGALIPPLECFDAVSKGSIESCWIASPERADGATPSRSWPSVSARPTRAASASRCNWKVDVMTGSP